MFSGSGVRGTPRGETENKMAAIDHQKWLWRGVALSVALFVPHVR